MKRKRLIQGIVAVFSVVLVVVGFRIYSFRGLTVLENPIFEIDPDEVNSIIIRSSDTAERIEIRDTERIEEICGLLNAFEYERYEPAPDADGWSTGITVHCVSTRVGCAFGSFAIFADILVVMGTGLILLALGLLFFWLFVWFIGGAIAGFINGVIKLGDKFSSREVSA